MGEPVPSDALVNQWSDREWRLNNLYWIEDKHGNVIKFKLNGPQEKLLTDLHYLNIVLKARQMGFSTFILILSLDCCLFNKHFSAGLIADTLPNAKNLLARIKFAYERLPKQIQQQKPIIKDNAEEIVFGNSSGIEVGVSLRSSTKNLLHISEYGKICAKDPGKAKEIKSGALNTLARGQLGFIESTAEGRGGDFYDKTYEAKAILESEREPLDMEYRLHFFPWYADLGYNLDIPYPLTASDKKYFKALFDEHGIELTDGQKWWYAAKSREQGEDMWKEYPSTVDEAFMSAKDGAYFAKQIRNLRQLDRIKEIPFDPRTPVNTFWDLGVNDLTTIWLHQQIGGRHRFVGYYENSGEGIDHYLDWLDKWRALRSARFGLHFGPHDIEHRKQIRDKSSGQLITIQSVASDLGYEFEVVVRNPDKLNSIQAARTVLPMCEFDITETDEGVKHLEGYSREWDEKFVTWKRYPRHDEHSHGADGFMTFADGWETPETDDYEQPEDEWVV